MDGGTFTISNGGVFGSMFGTPIINPPQSAILGMHGIFDRPVAVAGKVSDEQASSFTCRSFVVLHICLHFNFMLLYIHILTLSLI